MKSSIPTPVAVGIVVVVLAVIGFFVWKNSSRATSDVQAVNQTVNQGKQATEPLSQQEASGDAMMMGGRKGGR